MITLMENAKHQLTVAGTGMIAEARAGLVDVTGFDLLDAPEVVDKGDGSIILRIAVLAKKPLNKKSAPDLKSGRSDLSEKMEEIINEPDEDAPGA